MRHSANRTASLVEGVRLQLRTSSLTPLAVVSTLVTPLSYGILVSLGATTAPSRVFVGVALAGIWDIVLVQSLLAVLQERSWRTLDLLAAAPCSMAWPLTGRLLAVMIQGLVVVPVALVCVWASTASSPVTPLALLALLMGLLGFVGMGAMLLAVFSRFRFAPGSTNGLFGLVVLVSGLFGTVSALPGWLQVLGAPLGSTWAMRMLTDADPRPAFVLSALLDTAWSAAGIIVLVRVERGMGRRPDAFAV